MKREKNIKIIITIISVVVMALTCFHKSFALSMGKINVETANLREKPDENAKILEQFSINQEVEIIEKSGQWYKAKIQGITGYLRQDLVTVNEEIKKENNTVQNSNTTNENAQQIQETNKNTQQIQETNNQAENNTTEEKKIELGKNKIVEDTKLKILPIINAIDIKEAKKDEEVNVIEIINDWVYIELKETRGWIRMEKVSKIQKETPESNEQQEQNIDSQNKTNEEEKNTEEPNKTESKIETKIETKTLFVNASSVNVRKEANTSSEVITTLPMNTAVEVSLEENGWSKVKVNGKEGYISTALLSSERQSTSRSLEALRTENNSTEQEKMSKENNTNSTSQVDKTGEKGINVAETAKEYIGSKYVYGGTTPSGFDCSGFTYYIYKLYGVNLNRTAASQYNNGTEVNRKDLQPGDLVVFGKSGINHVGIYIGGGNMVHAANSSRGVVVDTINSGYYNVNYVGARRVI